MWEGPNTRECDGNLMDYSMLTYLASNTVKKLPGRFVNVKELLVSNFKANLKEEKFWF